VVKTILYERTVAIGTSMDFRKDLRRTEPRGDSGGSGWRKEAVKTGGRIDNIKGPVVSFQKVNCGGDTETVRRRSLPELWR